VRISMFIFCASALLLTGCTEKANEVVESPNVVDLLENDNLNKEKVSKSFAADPAKFHFVADWLTETKIVYIEKENGHYLVNTFDMESGQTDTLYEDSSMIIDVLIHPSQKYILLHTSDNSASATIKIMTTDGVIQDEITIASTELEIDWNDLDPSLILLTAFHPDWTFDLFLYNGKEKFLDLLEIKDPFPKWLGKDKVAYGDIEGHILDGVVIHTYEPLTGVRGQLDVSGAVYFDTYKNSLLVVGINEEKDAHYSIMEMDGVIKSEWTMPAISNYSEWVIPDIEWISNSIVFLQAPEVGGQLDELTSPYRLIRVVEGRQDVVVDEVVSGILRCSPSGQKCLTGYTAENLIDMEMKIETTWLTFPE
jgi:hypothetical protein